MSSAQITCILLRKDAAQGCLGLGQDSPQEEEEGRGAH